MNNLSIEKSLIHYAHLSISGHLAGRSHALIFRDIIERLAALDAGAVEYIFSADEVKKHCFDPPKSLDSSHITGKLRKETKLVLGEIATAIITIAARTSRSQREIHLSIQYIARHLWPLYSRDIDTNMIGFDLQEYSDFFADYSAKDREDLKNKLLHEWKEDGYIHS